MPDTTIIPRIVRRSNFSEGPMFMDVTGIDLRELVKLAYDGSVPVGLGFMHAKAGSLTEDEISGIVDRGAKDPLCWVDMDYVIGRCCKMSVFRFQSSSTDGLTEDSKLMQVYWYDHTNADYVALLNALGVEINLPTLEAFQMQVLKRVFMPRTAA